MPTDDYAVEYTPANVFAPKLSLPVLQACGIRYIRLQWVNLINQVQYRVIAMSHFLKILASPRPSICLAKATFGLVPPINVAAGFSPSGEYLYVPDMSSLKLCSYAPGHASVMGWFEEKAPIVESDGKESLEVPLCPRSILRRVVNEALSTGVEFLVGFETEFILLRSTNPIEAVNNYGWSCSPALGAGSVEAKAMEEIADALLSSGIELQMYHAEAAPGQYEVVTGPLTPLEAADALVHTRETIFNVAHKYGLRATLAPRVYMDNCGSGAHAHMSIHSSSSGRSSVTPNLNENEAFFLSSVLRHLPALTAINLPLRASYKRMMDGAWAGGTYVCWGTDNREAPIRLCNALAPKSRNFELKTLDGTANPYLALAGVLGVGFIGIRDRDELQIADCTGDKTAAQLGVHGREQLGINERLPLDIDEAWKRFEGDDVVRKIFGDTFVVNYLNVARLWDKAFIEKDEAAALQLLIENY